MIRPGGFLLLHVAILCFSGRTASTIDKYMNLEFLNIAEGIFDNFMVVLKGKPFCKLHGSISPKITLTRNKTSHDS